MRPKDRVIVATGGADGIGRTLAQKIAEEGATAVLVDINREKLEQTRTELRVMGLSCEAYEMNVTDTLAARFGKIDGWVNNAGITGKRPMLETSTEEFDRIMAVNVKGVFLCSKVAARVMVRQGHGSIDTPMTLVGRSPESYAASIRQIPLHRRGTPEDVAGTVILLLSDESAFIVGATLDVNGGSFMY